MIFKSFLKSNTEFEILFQDETAPGVAIPESGEGKVRGWQKEPLSIMWCLNSFVAESSSQSRLIYASTSQIREQICLGTLT